ncbi:O-antigen ligase family protein [Formosa haliotis]|uniref:O-antigen ligase family protein n=1 Tax=Formosa haliotis TaxID=1555194 RepID=UPI000824425C|nr:O-antigen ligase family protein [Formosa haliotis]
MKFFRYIILLFLICNIPSIILVCFGDSLGSFFSYLSFFLLLTFYLINPKNKPIWVFIIFAISYFTISGVINVDDEKYYYIDFFKYILLIVCSTEVARQTSNKELIIFFILGAISIVINAIFFPMDYGRYSGFYLDPNSAGFVCLIGCALSFSLKVEKWKLICFFIFTVSGALTFSRTFFLLWLIIVLFSILQNRKNIKILILGLGSILLFLSFASILKLNTERLSLLENIFNNNVINSSQINEDSRTQTWSLYYDQIFNSITFGNGYKSFSIGEKNGVGVHNNYLRILGEGGLIPFFLFICIYLFMLYKSLKSIKNEVYLFLTTLVIIAVHLTNHNFDTINHVTFISLWLFISLNTRNEIVTTKNESR